MDYISNNSAFVFGMFETGLGVARSLGKNNIKVFGFDHKKDIGSYSKYVEFSLCPNPITHKDKFYQFVLEKVKICSFKPVLYITSDEYLSVFSDFRNEFNDCLLFNIPNNETISYALNKTKLYSKLAELNIKCPKTFSSLEECNFPVLIKACNVNDWREKISGNSKVMIADNFNDLKKSTDILNDLKVDFVLQEIIPGDDNNFFKYCAYRTKEGEIIAEFMLQKLRQNPVRYGVGSLVKSIYSKNLQNLGQRILKLLDYNGVASIEFKYDSRDNTFKLIEINTRYWQQNILPDKCGVNFPFTEFNYLVNHQSPIINKNYDIGVKWINLYMDFSSFMKYRNEGLLNFSDWLDELKGEKVYSDLSSDDIIPGLYELFLSGKLKKIPKYIKGLFN